MSSKRKVMFVDDEEGVRTSWQRYFQERGITTTTAPDGASAIDRLSRQPVDVVVSDMRMPGKDGLELLEWLHVRQPKTRFIMLTGYGNDGLEGRVRQLGAVDYLEKPVSPEVLAHAVERALAVDRVLEADRESRRRAETHEPRLVVEEATVSEDVIEPPTATVSESPALTLGKIVAAPLLGLAFVIFLPVVGIAALGWLLVGGIKSTLRPTRV